MAECPDPEAEVTISSTDETRVRFCVRCGSSLERQIRFGKLRPVCVTCGWTYFADPKVAVALVVYENEKILLVRRVNEPFRGMWTLPAGFVDAGEDPVMAGKRECLEETGLNVEVGPLLDVIAGQEHPNGAHIIIIYRAEIIDGKLQAGDDVDEVAFFYPDNLPEIAFSTTKKILKLE